MRTHNKMMSYVGAVVLAIGAASPTFAQQTGSSCMAEIAQARAKIAGALAGGFPTPADPGGPGSGIGRQVAGGLPTPADPSGPNSGVSRQLAAGLPTPADPSGPNPGIGREVARGLPTPADPGGPNSGVSRQLAAGLPTPADPGGPSSGAGRDLAASSTGSSGRNARIQEAQALVDAAQSACDVGDNANAVAKARQAAGILQ